MPSLELPMSSNENPPQLTLSDIMHHMSPSPVPAEDSRPAEDLDMGGPYSSGRRREREGSPEPFTETDIVAMRRRLHALGFSLERGRNELSIGGDITQYSNDFGNTTLREKELLNMVLRLTDSLSVDATQLERQADIISVLTSQRDFLVRQAEEDRDRWHSEREGWDRIAEALLSHKNRSGKSATKEDETERQKVQLESENRALRDKLQDTQNRLSSLESDLMKLKPLLLMQPYSVPQLRQNLALQSQVPSQPLSAASTSGPHRLPDVRYNKPTLDVKGKQREADSTSSRTQLEAIPEDLETSGLGPSPLARSSPSRSLTSLANMPLFSGATNSTADIYRQPEPLSQSSYPYSYPYSTSSSSTSKSTLILPTITVNTPSSTPTGHGQPHHLATVGSPSKPLGSAVPQVYPTISSHSHSLPQTIPTPQLGRSRDYANHLDTSHNTPIRRRNHGITPLTSDARSEHILLAARRIGRERAGLVAGILQHAEREKEIYARELELIKTRQDLARSEKERLERLANGTSGLAYYRSTDTLTSPQQRNNGRRSAPAIVPRTPKRGGGVGMAHYPSLSGALSDSPISSPTRMPTSAGPSTFVFVNTSAAAGTSGFSDGGVLSNPSQLGSAHKRGGTARAGSRKLPSNPPTPLDSLLDAARSMMDDGAGGKAGGKITGTRKALEHPESPVPKRRRASSGSKTIGWGGRAGASTETRIRSALDVLADQAAAAFDEPGQSRKGSNTKGKGREKIVEGLGSGGNGGVNNIQEDEDVDDSWPRGSTSASASASHMGSSRRSSKVKSASVNTRPMAESTSTSMSLRPVRQASQKRLASQDLQLSTSVSITTARGRGRSRGRPKGSKSLPRSGISVKSSSASKTLGPRVIASAPTYSPLDEVIALLPQKGRRRESEEHAEWTTVDLDRSSSVGSPKLSLRPVVEWGERGAEEERDEDVEDEGDLVATGEHELELGQQNSHVGELDPDGAIAVDAGNDKAPSRSTANEAEFVSTLEINVQDMEEDAEKQIKTLNNVSANGQVSPVDVDGMTILPANEDDANTNANPEADLDDEDAEGEQEEDEDEENTDAEGGQRRSSRTRTPPPPDPPHPGAPSDSNDDPDADADAEGDMEFEENEEFPPTSTSSALYQTALSMPMGQVPPGNLDCSFSNGNVWLIKVFWMKSDKSFGYNMTSARVLISTMVPESLPLSRSILFDLLEQMNLQLAYPEQEWKPVVGLLEGQRRSIDVREKRKSYSDFLKLVSTPAPKVLRV